MISSAPMHNITTILQDGKPTNIAEEELRKGDILLLQAGDLVPADLKLTEARGLEVDEWDLTGEIAPVGKRVDGDNVYVYRGSRVTRGNGYGVVTATGDETEYAQCLKQSWERHQYRRPPLLNRNSLLILVLILPLFALELSRHAHDALLVLLGAVLTVVAVLLENSSLFEYIVTMRAVRAMEKRGIRIRDIMALTMAARLNIVCLDKTGVMTTRNLRVKQIYLAETTPAHGYFATDDEAARLTRLGCALCNDVIYAEKSDLANPVDRALITFARAHGADIADAHQKYRRVYDKPFDSAEKYMACGFESSGKTLYFVKGDPEVVLKLCRSCVTQSDLQQMIDLRIWITIEAHRKSISETGDVVIALAYAVGAAAIPPSAYTFLGLVQIENPLQPEAPGVLRALRREGIRTVMLTGDRSETALKIAAEAGVFGDVNRYLTGRQMVQMGTWDIGEQASYVSIFTRLLPSQKGLLVRLLQQKNKVVAMVGDGANDTVALKVADIGIAFGSDASPLAKRVSPIQINDLTDLVTIIQGARRRQERLDELAAFRAMLLIVIFLVLYAWVFFH